MLLNTNTIHLTGVMGTPDERNRIRLLLVSTIGPDRRPDYSWDRLVRGIGRMTWGDQHALPYRFKGRYGKFDIKLPNDTGIYGELWAGTKGDPRQDLWLRLANKYVNTEVELAVVARRYSYKKDDGRRIRGVALRIQTLVPLNPRWSESDEPDESVNTVNTANNVNNVNTVNIE